MGVSTPVEDREDVPGTAVEVNLTKEFEFPNGEHLDWRIAGIDIDCKFSKDLGGWEIPMEMYLCVDHGGRQGKADHPALLTWFDDTTNQWAAGLVTVTDDRLWWRSDKTTGALIRGYNRDNKRRLADTSAGIVFWLWGRSPGRPAAQSPTQSRHGRARTHLVTELVGPEARRPALP